ncbi:hypothetical protein AAMO2058_001583200 [Amorphochlora amoebiformis]|mmetsp:Transcript_2872/g.4376  ORF Transcript_2872/g.4376 Transcript_2872/m.4376 type:complete len:152 (-) Transcript_2872:309-764(-)
MSQKLPRYRNKSKREAKEADTTSEIRSPIGSFKDKNKDPAIADLQSPCGPLRFDLFGKNRTLRLVTRKEDEDEAHRSHSHLSWVPLTPKSRSRLAISMPTLQTTQVEIDGGQSRTKGEQRASSKAMKDEEPVEAVSSPSGKFSLASPSSTK